MSRLMINLPEKLNIENLAIRMKELSQQYEQSIHHDNVVFNFKGCKSLSPTGINFIIMWKDKLNELGINTFYLKPNDYLNDFLSDYGIFGKKISQSSAYKEYITKLRKCNNIKECQEVHDEIIKHIIKRKELSQETYAAIDYMINELKDNAGVHGYSCYESEVYPKPVYLCGFSYSDRIEISIGDRGQGIYNSLTKNNKEYDGISAQEALLAAIENGVSGHPKGSPGFGLYCSSEFIRQGKGFLKIWSSGCELLISNTKQSIKECYFDMGTLVSCTIYKHAQIPFEKILKDPIKGDRNASEYIEEFIGGIFV